MKLKGTISSVGVLVAAVAALALSASPAQAAWSPPATVTSETDASSPPDLDLSTWINQAILANGTSASSWLILGANDQIRTRTQDRAGSSLGPDTLVASLPVGTN
ncbi:MAG: hypothetical protein ACKOFX_07730, partial [Solirubrobacterales bacterium]